MEKKTFEDIKREVALAYKSKDYKRDFEYAMGLSSMISEEQFFDICAERYANHCANIERIKVLHEIGEMLSKLKITTKKT